MRTLASVLTRTSRVSDVAERRPAMLSRATSGLSSWFATKSLNVTGVERYGGDPTLFPIVSSLAESTGAVTYRLYRAGPSDAKEDREEVKPGQHPAVDLFLKPNPFQSRAEFVEINQQFIDLVGECIIFVESIAKLPVRLWPMQPWKLQPVKSSIVHTNANRQFLVGWIYTDDDGTQIPFKREEIIQIKLPDPNDPYRGVGPVQAALSYLDSARYSAEWNKNFFLNSASPDGVVQMEDSFSDDEFREFTERWRESHQGLSNAHRIAVLENGAVWVPNQMTQRDMQFQELQQLSSDFVRQAFRYPKTMLGTTDDANRAVAEAGEYIFGKWMIEPRAGRWVSALNNRLMPLYGETSSSNLLWDFDPVVESDEQVEAATFNTRATGVNTLILSGFDAADSLATAHLPPMKWTKPEVVVPGGPDAQEPRQDPTGTSGGGGRDGSDGTNRRETEPGSN